MFEVDRWQARLRQDDATDEPQVPDLAIGMDLGLTDVRISSRVFPLSSSVLAGPTLLINPTVFCYKLLDKFLIHMLLVVHQGRLKAFLSLPICLTLATSLGGGSLK